MPGNPPLSSSRPTSNDWFSAYRHRLGKADFSTASKNFFHPGNVLAFAFIALIIGFGIQGSVAAGVLSAGVLAVAAPSLLIICSLLVLASFFLTIVWSIYRFWNDYDEIYKQFEKLQAETLKKLEPSDSIGIGISNQDAKKTNAVIRATWRNIEGGTDFIETLRSFGLDVLDTTKFPDNVGPKGKTVGKYDSDSEDEEEDAGLPENGPNSKKYIPSRVQAFLRYKQFNYWTYTKFIAHEWSSQLANRAELTIFILLMIIAVILTACYFAGVASFMAPVFSTIVGFFDAAFAGLGMGGVMLSHAHVAAMALAGIAFCFGSINLIATLERAWRISHNFFDGLLTEPPAGFAEQEKARERPEVIGKPDSTQAQNLGGSSPSALSSPSILQNNNQGNLPEHKPG